MSLTNSFRSLLTKLILKRQIAKNIGLVNLFTTRGKTLNLHTTTINLEYLLPLGIMNVICLMHHIQFLTFKITLDLSI